MSIFKEELSGLAIQMIGFMPETLSECEAHHPILVSKDCAKKLPVFWKPRKSKRKKELQSEPQSDVVVKSENGAKKSCTQVSCPVSNCGATVSKTSAVLHMSYH